jgi:RHS repeat-associated protein
MTPSSNTNALLNREERKERPMQLHVRSNGSVPFLYVLLAIFLSVLHTPSHAAGSLCTRTDARDAMCAPMESFSTAHWGLSKGGSWDAYYQYHPSPWPDFGSPEALIRAFVAANPAATGCGTGPYVYQGFTYEYRLAGYYNNVYPATSPMSYADGISPDVAIDRQAEEAFIWYKWLVPSGGGPCIATQTIDIVPYQRRIGVCPAGFEFSAPLAVAGSEFLQNPEACTKGLSVDAKNLGACTGRNQIAGNPVSIASGNKFQQEPDIPPAPYGTLGFERYYNSVQIGSYELGLQWRHTYDRLATPPSLAAAAAIAKVSRPDGKQFTFQRLGTTWAADHDVADQLLPVVDANNNPMGWRYVTTTDDTEIYDSNGRLQSIIARNGIAQTLVYSDNATPGVPKAGLLIRVTDSLGRSLAFAYDAQARIVKVTDQAGQPYLYAYDQAGNLAMVTYPDLVQRQYLYNEMTHVQNADAPWLLTGIVDENGARFATVSYDAKGRATATEHADGVDRYQFSFAGTVPAVSTIVTDPLGTSRTYDYSYLNNRYSNTALSQPCVSCGGNGGHSITYDNNSNAIAIADFNGIRTTFAYDLTRNLETSRTEAAGTAQQRTINTQWHPTFRLPTQITESAPGGTKATTFTYDLAGNMLTKSILAPKNDGTGATTIRGWSWTYGTFGRTLTAVDPNGNVTTFTYYSDSDPNLGKRGNLASITNPGGHVTLITAYDAAGRSTTTSDANGLTTTSSYDERGRITARQIGIETTHYSYDSAGQLTAVTLPDASYLQYVYDDAHRLTEINDQLGDSIVYSLDAIGNRTLEQVFDPSDNLVRARSRVFDSLNRLAADLGAQAQATTYTYDNNDNRATTTDPLGHSNGNLYDALNRLTTVLDPNLGTVRYTYDAAGNLFQVTDQRELVTTYTYDGLNNLIKVQSPDTGTTVNTYDSAGNLLTKLDARGVTATYVHDKLNRVTQSVFHQGNTNETHQFQYDAGANGKGHLTQITDSAGVTAWTYNTQARVASKSQTVDVLTKTVGYGYNNAGLLATMTTPSGQRIGYSYTNNRVSAITVNAQTLLHGAVTMPFGPMSSWLWGNGLFTFRTFDSDGRVASWEFRNGVSILRKEQVFDAVSRIIAVNDPNQVAVNQTYQYDLLDRITVAQTGSPPIRTEQFTYDAVGNRLNLTIDNAVTNSAYAMNNNQLQMLSGSLPAGYSLGSGTWIFTYNNANRLATVSSGSTAIAAYRVNAQGQRVSKNVGGTINYFVYDEAGRLLGEYDGAGNLIEEMIWLEDLPVATLRPTGGIGTPTPINIYYVHADHLGSSRAVTRPSDNNLMWQWDNLDPFGANPPNENPSGQGVFKHNLRFPGQYYDAETGAHYNYFRDYDPIVGRYSQSDPIGLRSGTNTYVYVSGNSLLWSDQYGLAGGGFSTRYGNWCGKNWSGGHQGPTIPQNPAGPIDSVDACCMAHDYCWAKLECGQCGSTADKTTGKRDCDRVLVSCLDALKGKAPQNWPKPPPVGQEVDAYFFCQKAKWYFQ